MHEQERHQSTILVVEDMLESLKMLTYILTNQGYRVRPAIHAELAFQSIQKEVPDLILLDIKMPDMDGYEVCRRLKADMRTQDIPVIFLSALSATIDKIKAFESGGVDYITKPFQEEEVLIRVKTHLTIRQLYRALQEENERFRGLADASFEGILIHDQGAIVDLNPAMERLTGYTRAELLGKNAFDLLLAEPQTIADDQMHRSSEQPYEIIGRDKDGRFIPFEVQAKTIRYRGHDLRVLAIRDISWRKTLETLEHKTQQLEVENRTLRASLTERHHFGPLIGKSPTMQRVYERIIQAATSDETVIIYGETGSGKELVARTIFDLSKQYTQTFVAVNCGALQESLFESQFFGYRKGAFTGAERNMTGYFDRARGGTLFLDEIGELTPTMQAKLLRVLQDGEYTPLGATEARIADVRIIAASNQELRALKTAGRIREDFFQRIHVLTIDLPPLRYRKMDIPLLTMHFLKQQTSSGETPPLFPPELIERFFDYDWPGNVRELFNELRRYLAIGEVELSGESHLIGQSSDELLVAFEQMTHTEAMTSFERLLLNRVLEICQGNRSQAARQLELDRRTLQRKLAKYRSQQ